MTNMTKTIFAAACAFALTAAPALAADVEAGKKKAAEVCAACHGDDGNKPLTPDTPILAGQYADYLEHALRAFKKGARQNPLMSPMAQPLSDQDIRNLAAFFSQQTGLQVRY
jgi:cytochrome c553